ncbi:MAG: hypothetical protein ABIZ80_21610, partial [Bryobacteraceae bacterium]
MAGEPPYQDGQRGDTFHGSTFATFLLGAGSGNIAYRPGLAVRNLYWAGSLQAPAGRIETPPVGACTWST